MLFWVFFLMILTFSSDSHCSSPSPTLRMPRYADTIFIDSFRKVLAMVSARQNVRDAMSRPQGERNQEQEAKARLGRQVDSVWEGQKQLALESILVALARKHSGNSQG